MPQAWPSALALLAAALLACGCAEPSEESDALRLGYTPSDSTLGERERAHEALRDYLAAAIGRPVVLVGTSAYQPAIAAMRAGEIDVMTFGAQAYLVAEAEGAAEAFAQRGQPDGTPQSYESLLVVRRDSRIETLADVLAQSSSLEILYANSASTSGYLVLKRHLESVGADPHAGFKSARFSNSHALSVLKVAHGDADLANVSSRALAALVAEGKIDPETLRVVWRSEPVPSGPVAYRPDLPDPLKAQVRQAFFDLPRAAPDAWAEVRQLYSDGDFVYIPCQPGALDALRSPEVQPLSGSDALEL